MKAAKKRAKTVKKAVRAVTLLTRIEELLADVMKEGASIEKSLEKNVKILLRTAESAISDAKDYFIAPPPAKPVRKVAKVAKKAAPKVKAKAKAPVTAKKHPVAAKKRAATTVAVAKPQPEVILPPFVTPAPPATPPIIIAH